MTTIVTHYKVEDRDGAFAVDAVTKKYGSLGPDPGREIHREPCVEGVSREYAEMLARELTSEGHKRAWPRDLNIFSAAESVKRTISMWVGPNAEEWAERVNHPIVY